MTPPVAAVNGIRQQRGSRVVLDLEQLVIPPGTTALLGPNGAGKTTLLRLIATVDGPDSGTVMIDGRRPDDPGQLIEVRRMIGFAPQHDGLPERMKVADFCDYVAALKEISPRRRRLRWTDWVLETVGLREVRNQRISTLSGGMRRRLVIAQSMLGGPGLLILDEPLVSLDAEHRSAIVRAIAESADERTTVVATHHADELGAICRHVVVLAAGRLAFAGPPGQLSARAEGRVFEASRPIDHPSARAMGPDRYRVVDHPIPGARSVTPTVHDGYLAVVADFAVASA